jgi:hypothetical protein
MKRASGGTIVDTGSMLSIVNVPFGVAHGRSQAGHRATD